MHRIRIATRGSRLALWQAEHIKARLCALYRHCTVDISIIQPEGDIVLDKPLAANGGKGLFVKEIEEAVLRGNADLAVHSIKDMPAVLPDELVLACIPEREAPEDCLLSLHWPSLDALPKNATVGTSSLRRQAQLLHLRPDLRIEMLRGNVDTRLRRLAEGRFEAVILAAAGIRRLGLSAPHMTLLAPSDFLPAVGQGTLGVECRADNPELLDMLRPLDHMPTRIRTEAERAFLAALDGGCRAPIAGYAVMLTAERFVLEGMVAEVDGTGMTRMQLDDRAGRAVETGRELAARLLKQGAARILQKFYANS